MDIERSPDGAVLLRRGLPFRYATGGELPAPQFDVDVDDIGGIEGAPLLTVTVNITSTVAGAIGSLIVLSGSDGDPLVQPVDAGINTVRLQVMGGEGPTGKLEVAVMSIDAANKLGIRSAWTLVPEVDFGPPTQVSAPSLQAVGGEFVPNAIVIGTQGAYDNHLGVESLIEWRDAALVVQGQRHTSPQNIPDTHVGWSWRLVDLVTHADGATVREFPSEWHSIVSGTTGVGPAPLTADDFDWDFEDETINGKVIEHTMIAVISDPAIRAQLTHAVWISTDRASKLNSEITQGVWNRFEKDADFANNGKLRQRAVGGGVPDWLSRKDDGKVSKVYPMTVRWSNSAGTFEEAVFSPNSPTENITVPEAAGGGGNPVPVNAEIARFSIRTKVQHDAGLFAHSAEQVCMSSCAVLWGTASWLVLGQDVGNGWISQDGKHWNTVRARGLENIGLMSIEIDPANPLHMIGLQPSAYGTDGGGFYETWDGMHTWTKILAIQKSSLHDDWQSKIAFAPGNVLNGVSQICAMVTDSEGFRSTEKGTPGLYLHDQAGGGVQTLRSLPAGTFGEKLIGCKFDPSDDKVLYVWGDVLTRFNNFPNNVNDYDILSGSNGLPNGTIYGDLYISPDGQTLICGRNGCYRSTNGASTAQGVTSWHRRDNPTWGLTGLWVSPVDPDYMMGWHRKKPDQIQSRYSHDGGQSWTPISVSKTGGGGATLTGNATFFIPDPQDKNIWTGFSLAKIWRSENAGQDFVDANHDYDGTHIKEFSDGLAGYDRNDPLKIGKGLLDRGVAFTDNGGDWWTVTNPRKVFVDADPQNESKYWGSTAGLMRWPDGHMVACVKRDNSQHLALYDRNSQGNWEWSILSTSSQVRWGCGIDAGNNNYAYQWQEFTSNQGRRWQKLDMPDPEAVIVGVSWLPVDGRSVIYAVDVTSSLNQSGSPQRRVWKSTNRGQSWSLVFTSTTPLRADRGTTHTLFRVNPMNPHEIFIRGVTSNGRSQIRRVNTEGTTAVVDNIDLLGGAPLPENFYVTAMSISAQTPGFYLARTNAWDVGQAFFRTFDFGKTWENLSEIAMPFATNNSHGMSCHPLTDNVILGTTQGNYIMKRPPQSHVPSNVVDLFELQQDRWSYRDSHLAPVPLAA